MPWQSLHHKQDDVNAACWLARSIESTTWYVALLQTSFLKMSQITRRAQLRLGQSIAATSCCVYRSTVAADHLDVAIDVQVLNASELAPQHIKLRADTHDGANAVHTARATQSLPIQQSVTA